MAISKRNISHLPSSLGLYFFKENDQLLYIGKSVNIKSRVLSHLRSAKIDRKEKLIINRANKVDYLLCDSEFKALLAEAKLINQSRPKYNVIWKDDKSNLYIKISINEDLPKIYPARLENDMQSLHFGPFPSINTVEFILREIRKVFPYCSQKKISKRPCFYSKINRCNPCPNLINKITNKKVKQNLKKIYKKNIRQIIKILSGKFELVLKNLRVKLKAYSARQQYEQALVIRNNIIYLERFLYQQLKINDQININISEKRLLSLKQLLKNYFPDIDSLARIECYDVSNLSGQEATGSMVTFINGLTAKSYYRRFKIINESQSDLNMIEEIIKRRLKYIRWGMANLIIVDGGRLQITAVKNILKKNQINIPVIGLEKNPDRIVIGINQFPVIKVDFNNLGYNFVRHIRDESHRFARKYHLYLRSKRIFLI